MAGMVQVTLCNNPQDYPMLAPLADSLPAVRFATVADEDALVAMVKRMHEDPEWGLRDWGGLPFKPDEEKVRGIIQAATVANRNAPDAGSTWIGVVCAEGGITASVCMTLQAPTLSCGQYLEILWNWVAPEHRRSGAAHLLINFAIQLADAHQLTLVGSERMFENGGRARLLQRRIGRPVGSVFAYNSAAGTA